MGQIPRERRCREEHDTTEFRALEEHVDPDAGGSFLSIENGPTQRVPQPHYTVLGALILPRPPNKFEVDAIKWEKELQKLNMRNMDGKPAL